MALRACQSTTRALLARNLSWRAATALVRLHGLKYSEKNSPYSTTAGKESEKVAGRTVVKERRGSVITVAINRPEVRNAVNQETAGRLLDELTAFDSDPALTVAVLHGNGGNFCAGYDLKELAHHTASLKLEQDVTKGPAPMGPSRLVLSKPLIAAVSGYAVAGGLELALLADLRVVEESAVMGVFCRRFGVPLIDGGTVRLPRLIGLSRALDLILTGRPIGAQEALAFGLANRVVPDGQGDLDVIQCFHVAQGTKWLGSSTERQEVQEEGRMHQQ
ncbi:enoyl-CoA hydratase EchA19 isoform 4-T4 [Salvelinus alpinus]